MVKQMKLSESSIVAVEAYVLTLLKSGIEGVHVTHVIPPHFEQFHNFVLTSTEMTYDKYSGWFRLVGWTPSL